MYNESPNTNTLLALINRMEPQNLWGVEGDCNSITTRILQTPKHTVGPRVLYSSCFRAAVSQVAINTVQK